MLPAMARQEHDREDLLREATAMVQRVELEVPAWPEPVFAGFRREGAASVLFGPEVGYQFNAAGELRRAFVHGVLYKAQRRRLASLTRHRQADQVVLLRHDLTDDETEQFLSAMSARLQSLVAALQRGDYRLVGQVPAEGDVVGRVRTWLAALPAPPAIARSPHVR
jgi:hypothetical protein